MLAAAVDDSDALVAACMVDFPCGADRLNQINGVWIKEAYGVFIG
jgi:hypothetical protein